MKKYTVTEFAEYATLAFYDSINSTKSLNLNTYVNTVLTYMSQNYIDIMIYSFRAVIPQDINDSIINTENLIKYAIKAFYYTTCIYKTLLVSEFICVLSEELKENNINSLNKFFYGSNINIEQIKLYLAEYNIA